MLVMNVLDEHGCSYSVKMLGRQKVLMEVEGQKITVATSLRSFANSEVLHLSCFLHCYRRGDASPVAHSHVVALINV